MPATPAWLAAVEAIVNRGIQGSSQAIHTARRLNTTCLRLDIEGVISIRAAITGGRIALVTIESSGMAGSVAEADATIGGTPFALLQLAKRNGPDRTSARGAPHASRATVRGDAEIANLYRELFTSAQPDLEEELSRVVGDLAARRLSSFTQRAMAWAKATRRTAGENMAEYLQEESRDLVNKTELDEFLQSVDRLREAADRVDARIARLAQRLQAAS